MNMQRLSRDQTDLFIERKGTLMHHGYTSVDAEEIAKASLSSEDFREMVGRTTHRKIEAVLDLNGEMLKYVPEALQTKQMCRNAIYQWGGAIKYARYKTCLFYLATECPSTFLDHVNQENHPFLTWVAFYFHPMYFFKLKKQSRLKKWFLCLFHKEYLNGYNNLTKRMYRYLAWKDPTIIIKFPPECQTEKMQLRMIREAPLLLDNLKEQTHTVCMAACKLAPQALGRIHDVKEAHRCLYELRLDKERDKLLEEYSEDFRLKKILQKIDEFERWNRNKMFLR